MITYEEFEQLVTNAQRALDQLKEGLVQYKPPRPTGPCAEITIDEKQHVFFVEFTDNKGPFLRQTYEGDFASPDPPLQPVMQTIMTSALIWIEKQCPGIMEDNVSVVLTQRQARLYGRSFENKAHIKGAPDALTAVCEQRNPHRRYSLCPFLYGIRLRIENRKEEDLVVLQEVG
jgi:hypothetical protein